MIKYELELDYSDYWWSRTLKTDSTAWKKIRQVILKRDNWTCSFCEIRLSKWLIVDHIDGDGSNNNLDNLRLNCSACDKIRHCGLAGINGEIQLGISKLSQVEIVIRSHAFFIANNRNPALRDIDKKARLDKEDNSCFWIAECRRRADYYKNIYQDYKGFFTKEMWFGYLEFVIKD